MQKEKVFLNLLSNKKKEKLYNICNPIMKYWCKKFNNPNSVFFDYDNLMAEANYLFAKSLTIPMPMGVKAFKKKFNVMLKYHLSLIWTSQVKCECRGYNKKTGKNMLLYMSDIKDLENYLGTSPEFIQLEFYDYVKRVNNVIDDDFVLHVFNTLIHSEEMLSDEVFKDKLRKDQLVKQGKRAIGIQEVKLRKYHVYRHLNITRREFRQALKKIKEVVDKILLESE